MRIRILACAEEEIAEAVDYYNAQRPGLGFEFAEEVKKALNRISAFPQAWPHFSHATRRCMVSRFPYGVVYQSREDLILVFGLMHLRCDPKRWQDRAKGMGCV